MTTPTAPLAREIVQIASGLRGIADDSVVNRLVALSLEVGLAEAHQQALTKYLREGETGVARTQDEIKSIGEAVHRVGCPDHRGSRALTCLHVPSGFNRLRCARCGEPLPMDCGEQCFCRTLGGIHPPHDFRDDGWYDEVEQHDITQQDIQDREDREREEEEAAGRPRVSVDA